MANFPSRLLWGADSIPFNVPEILYEIPSDATKGYFLLYSPCENWGQIRWIFAAKNALNCHLELHCPPFLLLLLLRLLRHPKVHERLLRSLIGIGCGKAAAQRRQTDPEHVFARLSAALPLPRNTAP